MSDHICPSCDTKLTPSTATVRTSKADTGRELTAEDAIGILSKNGDQMLNVVLICDSCSWSITRTVTIRSNE